MWFSSTQVVVYKILYIVLFLFCVVLYQVSDFDNLLDDRYLNMLIKTCSSNLNIYFICVAAERSALMSDFSHSLSVMNTPVLILHYSLVGTLTVIHAFVLLGFH